MSAPPLPPALQNAYVSVAAIAAVSLLGAVAIYKGVDTAIITGILLVLGGIVGLHQMAKVALGA